jgi:hypothetical protein
MVMHIGIYPEDVFVIVVCMVAATPAAGLYPAWKNRPRRTR